MVTVYQMPSKFGQGDYWGFFPNNQIFKEVSSGQRFSVPTDWYFMVLFEVDYDRWYGSQSIVLRSWVSEYSPNDAGLIQNSWQPTATEYISPQEKQRREEEKQAKIEALLIAERAKKQRDLEVAKLKAEADAKKKEEELELLKQQEKLEQELLD